MNNHYGIKVLHLLSSKRFSGAENVVCQIFNMFSEDSDIEMIYVSPSGDIENSLNEKGINYYMLKKFNTKELNLIVDDFKPDIIHAHDVRATILATTLHKKVQIISTIHGNDIKMRKLGIKSVLYCIAARNVNHIFWVSKSCYWQFFFRKNVENKSTILSNVIDRDELLLKVQQDENEYGHDVTFIGRLAYPKDPMRFLSIMENAIQKKSDLKVAIVGTGNYEDEIRQRIIDRKLQNNVYLYGFMENPYKLLSKSKLLMLTSEWEGMPMVVLEAMALGIPIVSTPTDGVCEVIRNGETGYLSDKNEKLLEAVLKIVSNDSLLKKMSDKTIYNFFKINNIDCYKKELKNQYSRGIVV